MAGLLTVSATACEEQPKTARAANWDYGDFDEDDDDEDTFVREHMDRVCKKSGVKDPRTMYKTTVSSEVRVDTALKRHVSMPVVVVKQAKSVPASAKANSNAASTGTTPNSAKAPLPKEPLDSTPRKSALQATSPAVSWPGQQSPMATASVAEAAPPPEEEEPALAGSVPTDEKMTESELRIEEATRKAKQHSGGLKIFSGNGNMALSLEVARHLGVNLGKATVGRFADGEVNVVIHENVRGKDVYVIQPTCPPVNDNIMELMLMVSTLRRSSARRITVVIPYYGYARQDRKMQVCVFARS
jgi:N-terminal domain of ribose phosphate pyrophosphokinase